MQLPVIDIAQQPRDVLAEAWDVLLALNSPPRLFRRGNSLVMLDAESPNDESHGTGDLIQVVSKDVLAGLLVAQADWVRAENPAQPPDFILRMMLSQPHPILPKLECITSVPILALSGRIVHEIGYHPDDNLYLLGNENGSLGVVHRHPTLEDLDAARTLLLEELLGDFPFCSDSDRGHALALLLLPFVRPFLQNALTPLHLITARTPGSGKSLLAQVVSYLVANKPAVVTTLNSHDSESRKKLTALLLQGAPVVVLDNLAHGLLDNANLASILTAPVWTDRQLGHSRALHIRNQTMWLATGNNPRFSMELARRAVRIRLNSLTERPWLRTGFRHPDLIGWVRENRHSLVRACLTLIQAWLDEGQPAARVRPLGSFERWSEVLGGILHAAGVPGFLDGLGDFYCEVDAESQEWRILTAQWWSRFQGQYVRVTDLLPLCAENDLMGDILGQGSERSQKSRLGRALQRCTGRTFGNLCIEQDGQAVHNSGRYRLHLLRATGDSGNSAVNASHS